MTSTQSFTPHEKPQQTLSGYTLLSQAEYYQKQYVDSYSKAMKTLPSKKTRIIFINYLHYYENLHSIPEEAARPYIGKISEHDKRINARLGNVIEDLAKEVLVHSTRWDDFYTEYPDISHIAFMLAHYPERDILNKASSKRILAQSYPLL